MLAYITSILPHHTLSYDSINLILNTNIVTLPLDNIPDRIISQYVDCMMNVHDYKFIMVNTPHHILVKYMPSKVNTHNANILINYTIDNGPVTADKLTLVSLLAPFADTITGDRLGYYHILGGDINKTYNMNSLYGVMIKKQITEEEIKYLATVIDFNREVYRRPYKEKPPIRSVDKIIIRYTSWQSISSEDIEDYVCYCLLNNVSIPLQDIIERHQVTPGMLCIAIQYNIDVSKRGIVNNTSYSNLLILNLRVLISKANRRKAYNLLPMSIRSYPVIQRIFK